jgi:hypothetical protein
LLDNFHLVSYPIEEETSPTSNFGLNPGIRFENLNLVKNILIKNIDPMLDTHTNFLNQNYKFKKNYIILENVTIKFTEHKGLFLKDEVSESLSTDTSSFKNNEIKKFFYLSDYTNSSEMLKDVIDNLLKPKYSGYNIYIHNFSNFDGIFLLNAIILYLDYNNMKVSPLIKDGKFINIKINYGPNFKYNISFRDSYLLLPRSLSNLSTQFKVEHTKTTFPYNFVNDNLNKEGMPDLNYVGEIPQLEYFNNISDYSNYILDYLTYSTNIKPNLYN